MHLVLIGFLLAFLSSGHAQDANCDFYQSVSAGRMYYIYSPGYPRNYTPGVTCRWEAVCPAGYNCHLECPDINLPKSQSCSLDKLLISRSGDTSLTGAESYCGQGTISATSDGQRIVIGLVTSTRSPGGRFYCELTAKPKSVTPSCRCGYKKMNRIVGGQDTGVNEYPMMAGIVYRDIVKIKCGAVIISTRHVMSAAHCVINRRPANVAVVVGEHDVTSTNNPARRAYRVSKLETHPLFSTSNNDYDVAIVTVLSNIAFSDQVGPVCLPFKFLNNDFTGAKVTVLGWGTLFPGGPDSNVLQKVDVNVISQSTCRNQVPAVTPQQVCTYTPGKDSCQDDSGGPLLYTDPSNGLLYSVGIVSYGYSCASRLPAINTRVTTILDWVVFVTKENFCRI